MKETNVNRFEKLINSDKLLKIRKQLAENKDEFGNELETIELLLDSDVEKMINDTANEYELTFNEVVWLLLEDIINKESENEKN